MKKQIETNGFFTGEIFNAENAQKVQRGVRRVFMKGGTVVNEQTDLIVAGNCI